MLIKALRTLLLVIALGVLAACAPDADPDVDTDDAADDIDDVAEDDAADDATDGERVLRMSVPENQSPDLSAEWAYDDHRSIMIGNVLETLTRRDPNDAAALIPSLATSWEQVDDLTWRFNLREGATFSDGNEFNAETAKLALEHVWRDGSRLTAIGAPIVEVEVVDDYVIDIITPSPVPILPERLYQTHIPSPELIEDESRYGTEVIGTGPYVITELDVTQRWVLEANPDWWGHDDPEAYGEVVYDRVVFDIRPEAASRAAALDAGEVDFAFDIGVDGCERLIDRCEEVQSGNIVAMKYDVPSTFMGDIRVREALNLAFDRYTIAQELYGSEDAVVEQIMPPGTAGYSPNIEPPPYDPERARELLEEAMADGATLDGRPLQLWTMQGRFARNSEFVQIVADQWQQNLGIDVEVSIPETAEFEERLTTNENTIPPDRHLVAVHTRSHINLFDLSAYLPLHGLCDSLQGGMCEPDFDEQWNEAAALSGQERIDAMVPIAEAEVERMMWNTVLALPQFDAVSENVEYRRRADNWVHVFDFSPAQ